MSSSSQHDNDDFRGDKDYISNKDDNACGRMDDHENSSANRMNAATEDRRSLDRKMPQSGRAPAAIGYIDQDHRSPTVVGAFPLLPKQPDHDSLNFESTQSTPTMTTTARTRGGDESRTDYLSSPTPVSPMDLYDTIDSHNQEARNRSSHSLIGSSNFHSYQTHSSDRIMQSVTNNKMARFHGQHHDSAYVTDCETSLAEEEKGMMIPPPPDQVLPRQVESRTTSCSKAGPKLAPAAESSGSFVLPRRASSEVCDMLELEEKLTLSGQFIAPALESVISASSLTPPSAARLMTSYASATSALMRDNGPQLAPSTSAVSSAASSACRGGGFSTGFAALGGDETGGDCYVSRRLDYESPTRAAAAAAPPPTGRRTSEVIVAQAGIPIRGPGAIFIPGIDASDDDLQDDDDGFVEYDADDDDLNETGDILRERSATMSTAPELESARSRDFEYVLPENAEVVEAGSSSMHLAVATSTGAAEFSAVDAEVVEEALDAQVVTDDENPKDLPRRWIVGIVGLVCIILTGVIIGIVFGVRSRNNGGSWESPEDPRILNGWAQVGPDVMGPQDEPQVSFGYSVAMSRNGSRIAISAPGYDEGIHVNTGQVRIFDEVMVDSGNHTRVEWSLTETIYLDHETAGESQQWAAMSLSLSEDGKRVAIGRPHAIRDNVLVYEEQPNVDDLSAGSDWSLIGSFSSPLSSGEGGGEVTGSIDWFGYSAKLSAHGDHLVIGAPLADAPPDESDTETATRSGMVQLWFLEDVAQNWTQVGSSLYGTTTNEFLGWSVDLVQPSFDSNPSWLRLAAGGPAHDAETGLVRVWDTASSTVWETVGQVLHGEDVLGRFGESVSLSQIGDVLAVGASAVAFDPGLVRVFRLAAAINSAEQQDTGSYSWEEDELDAGRQQLFGGLEPAEGYGTSVALSHDGNTVAIGAPHALDQSGRIHVLEYRESGNDGGAWETVGRSIYGAMDGDELGASVALSWDGKRVLGGAPSYTFDGHIAQAGTARVFDGEE